MPHDDPEAASLEALKAELRRDPDGWACEIMLIHRIMDSFAIASAAGATCPDPDCGTQLQHRVREALTRMLAAERSYGSANHLGNELLKTVAAMAARAEGYQEDIRRLLQAVHTARVVADYARGCWDQDQNARVGKLLAAMAGDLPRYRSDLDEMHAAFFYKPVLLPPLKDTPPRPEDWTLEKRSPKELPQ